MSSSPRLSHLPAHRQPAWRASRPALLSLRQLFEGRNRLIEPITLTAQLPEHVLDIHDGRSPGRPPLSLLPAPDEASAATEQDEP